MTDVVAVGDPAGGLLSDGLVCSLLYCLSLETNGIAVGGTSSWCET